MKVILFSAFAGPEPDPVILRSFVCDKLDIGTVIKYPSQEGNVLRTFETRVPYGEEERPWTEWMEEMKSVGAFHDEQQLIISGQAPGFLFAMFAKRMAGPGFCPFFVNMRFGSVIPVKYDTQELKNRVFTDVRPLYVRRTSGALSPNIFILHVYNNQNNLLTLDNRDKIVNKYLDLTRERAEDVQVTEAQFGVLKMVDVDVMQEMHDGVITRLEYAKQCNTNTLIVSCASMDAVAYMIGSEACKMRYQFDAVLWAEMRRREGSVDYDLLRLI